MAGLASGGQYVLSSSAHSCPDRTALLLKLTDSSLKTIERYQKTKGYIKDTPTILFKGRKGIITIPDGKDGFQDFKFVVQPLPEPSGSSYECIQQFTNSKGEPHLDSISRIQTKVIISATDDVYQTTQEKMKLADEEMKKISTKEVSQKELKATRKIKRITKHPSLPTHKSAHLPRPSQLSHCKPTNTSSAISRSNGTQPASSRVSHVTSKGAPTSKPTAPNRSFRDRVIHLLALRPYKKPELILRLQKDGIVMKDKNQLSSILSQVATLSRDNAYMLHKHLYSEIQEDWPLYNDADRQLLRNLRSSNQKEHSSFTNSTPSVSLSSSSSSARSASAKLSSTMSSKDVAQKRPVSKSDPVRTAANKFKATISHKRPLLPDVVDYKPPKKTRIAHNTKKLSPTPDRTTSSHSPPSKDDVTSTTKQSPDYCRAGKPDEKDYPKCREPVMETKSKVVVGKQSPPSDVSSTSSGPDYLNKFMTITSHEQKQHYKDIFNTEYVEYKKMHAYVEDVNRKFTKLKNQLHRAPEDSEEYRHIKKKVIEEYEKIKAEYQKKEARRRELHNKLGHIKGLIAAYDSIRQ
ncbi:RNA polymerase II elongation factor ELL-like [Acanthaster planci]|uniref:RNA polymerase II elongation factor ELL-like n=1 Tax=Acanthaster planci TaxID=133434 RepID=A0A8B7ZBG1_ACAPL|nr:RNA polymerase II elongation factor ELL-like [Acanthaster planci]